MKYEVDRIEDNKIVLIDLDTRKEVVKDYDDLPKVVTGDIVYHDEEEDIYIVDTKARIERMKNIRVELNDILEMEDNDEEDNING